VDEGRNEGREEGEQLVGAGAGGGVVVMAVVIAGGNNAKMGGGFCGDGALCLSHLVSSLSESRNVSSTFSSSNKSEKHMKRVVRRDNENEKRKMMQEIGDEPGLKA
jgi:hypothetical protein